jgi:F-type H+-transporting ATPase subunit b
MQFLTNFGDSSSGLGALGVDGKAFIIQLITFILAYFVLRRYAFGPIIKVLQTRRETIENGVKLGEQMKREQAELAAKVEQALHDARLKADAIIAGAQDTGRQLNQEAEAKARDKAASIIAAAEDRTEQAMAQARQMLQRELVGLVADATEAIIDEKVDATKDTQLIERALKIRQGRPA